MNRCVAEARKAEKALKQNWFYDIPLQDDTLVAEARKAEKALKLE